MNTAEQTVNWLKLLLAFNALPHTKRSRTFMDVSGYPHYENVCSNILAFYFDPSAEHGLKDLLLAAFLEMAGKEQMIGGAVTVSREYGTANGRIDLLVEGEACLLVIENKIYHWLANDLEDYAKTANALKKDGQEVVKVVLGLQPIKEALNGGFIGYTYNQLWQVVRNLLGNYIGRADAKWVTYLLDFMETTANLAGQNMELKQTDQFFIEHHDAIQNLLTERDAFQGRLNTKVSVLCQMMSETEEASLLCKPPWIYSKSCLVLDFKLDKKHAIAIDLYVTPKGWEFKFFGRTAPSRAYLNSLVQIRALNTLISSTTLVDGYYVSNQWSLNTDLGEICDALRGWIATVSDAAVG